MNRHEVAAMLFFFPFVMALFGKEGWGWCLFIGVLLS